MANEDMMGSSVGESIAQNKWTHSKEEASHTVEDLESAVPAMAKDYTEKAAGALDEAKKRVRTLQENGEDYVRTNPTKAVLAALGVGFILAIIFKR
jgi:ElaB/YqjD/DUF883 family membrane-anchored ribosome-binding protein